MSRRRLQVVLVAAGIVAIVLATLALLSQNTDGRNKVLQELPKATYQFLLVGILGVFVKYLIDRHAGDMAHEDALNTLRKDTIRQVVEVKHRVRRAPILISARRTAASYSEQMSEIIDASFDLGTVRHDIDNLGIIEPNEAFEEWNIIRRYIRNMEQYLSSLIEEYANAYDEISELQTRVVEDEELQLQVWQRIMALPSMSDLLSYLAGQSGTAFKSQFLDEYSAALTLILIPPRASW
jgi:hypothetical protein